MMGSRGTSPVQDYPYRLLVDASEAMAAVRDLADVVRVVDRVGRTGFGASSASVALVEPGRGTLRHLDPSRVSAPLVRALSTPSLRGEAAPAAVVHSGTELALADPDAVARAFPHLRGQLGDDVPQAVSVLPLLATGQVLGTLVLLWDQPHAGTAQERVAMRALAGYTAQAVRRCRQREQDRDVARTLQEAMLTALPEPDDLQLAARYLPAAAGHRVGGDWYDAVVRPGGATAVVIGDVTGHDIAAAATMGQLRSILRGFAVAFPDPPAGVLARLDAAMAQLHLDHHATAVLAVVEQDEQLRSRGLRRLRWSNAGHLPPLLVLPDGAVHVLDGPEELLLGVLPAAERSDHCREVPCGATLLLHTDGLVERRGQDLGAALEALPAALAPLADAPLEDLLDELLEEVGPADAEYDIALLAVRFG